MIPKILTFVDIETTGTRSTYDRVLEIGMLRVENNRLKKKFTAVVNPLFRVDPFIFGLTGISPSEIANAPTFEEIKDEILSMLEDAVFVAHNVRFDYSFLRNEFRRMEISFSAKQLCTVKLARNLYPGYARYNLDTIIERYNIVCKRRHRAFDDAKVLWDFYKKTFRSLSKKAIEKGIDLAMKRPTIPINLSFSELETLPESSGVYIFYDQKNVPLYIGKSINIRDRVLSHFSNDHLSSIDMAISQQIKKIKTVQTAGELGALLLEATMIKDLQPMYNRQLRYARKIITIEKYEKDNYPSGKVIEKENIEIGELDNILGVFRSVQQGKDYLYSLCKEFMLCPKIFGLEKTKRHCFYYSLGTCRGACIGKENSLRYNMRFLEATSKNKIKKWPFKGPILITENESWQESFLVDKWCLLGKFRDESDLSILTSDKYKFDTDTYKILWKYLKSSQNLRNVRTLSV